MGSLGLSGVELRKKNKYEAAHHGSAVDFGCTRENRPISVLFLSVCVQLRGHFISCALTPNTLYFTSDSVNKKKKTRMWRRLVEL